MIHMTMVMKADLESLEVVDEDIWKPELIDKLKVDRNHLAG